MRFLIIGLGSAGQRHARVIRNMFPNSALDAFVGEHRTGLISPDLKSIDYSISPISFYEMSEIKSFDNLQKKYDLTVIATPIATHFEYFERTQELSKRWIIEKPIGSHVSEAEKILAIAIRKNVPILIGYQHNFNPLVKLIIELKNRGGVPKSISLTFHEYLRSMNAFRDMSDHHLAQPNGGGVLLALSHELDILMQLYDFEISEVKACLKKSEEFPDVFDRALVSYQTSPLTIPRPAVSVSLSYAAGEKKRCGRIEWDGAELHWDLISGKVTSIFNGVKKEILLPLVSGDQLIALQLVYTLNKSSFDQDLLQRFNRALDILRINEAAKVLDSLA